MSDFDELAKYHSLSLMRWDEDFYASENTQLAKAFYEAGKQSLQAEINDLKKRIDDAVVLLEYNEYVDSALQALEVLKGGTNE